MKTNRNIITQLGKLVLTYITVQTFLVPATFANDENSLLENTGIEIYHAEGESVLSANTPVVLLADGFKWTEGPLWVDSLNALLFSDIPNNIVYKYQEGKGVTEYLRSSGASRLFAHDSMQGSNGLLLNPNNELVLFQQGDRRLAIMDAPLDSPTASYKVLSATYQNKRFNSPNDGVYMSNGDLFFTDPPYGLKGRMKDENKQIAFQGVYRLDTNGKVSIVDKEVKFPNGIGLSPDEKTLYVAASDPAAPYWFAYTLNDTDGFTDKRIFYDATEMLARPNEQGYPDGMAVHSSGIIFATGPGGVLVFNPDGILVAKIRTGRLTANCTLSKDEKTLYISAHDTLMSVQLN